MRLANQSLNPGCRRGMTAGLQPKRKGREKDDGLRKAQDVLEPERFGQQSSSPVLELPKFESLYRRGLSLCLHQVFCAGKDNRSSRVGAASGS
jgi:hypothetical protein